jgi:hypothetical protein
MIEMYSEILDKIEDFEVDWYQKYVQKKLDKNDQEYLDSEFEDINNTTIYELKDVRYTEYKLEQIFVDIDQKLEEEIHLKEGVLQKYKKYKKDIRKMYKELY